MKIVQTSWTCNNIGILQYSGGWYSPEYHLMAWALSCLQLRRYYDEVVLHANSFTSGILIDYLKLPYTNVVCDLDCFNHYPPELWGLVKIHTYSQQTTPFLHVDGDIFIWEPFDKQLLRADLIAQNLEIGTDLSESRFKDLEAQLSNFPTEVIEEKNQNKTIYGFNAGILGGSDLDFFNMYTQKAKKFINNNIDNLSKIRIGDFNVYFEQYLFYCLANKYEKKVSVLIKETLTDYGYMNLGGFADVPYNKKYLHLIGGVKRLNGVCLELANRLRQDYPEYYYRIIALFKTKKIILKTDYYHFVNTTSETALTERYYKLKDTAFNNNLVTVSDNLPGAVSKKQYSSHIVESLIARAKGYINDDESALNYTNILNDAKLFEEKLTAIVNVRFSEYSIDYLYSRDIKHTQYFEYVFADKNMSSQRTLVTDSIIEFIESEFDWARFDFSSANASISSLNIKERPAKVYACVIPECHAKGYSLVKIDELDMELLKILGKPTTISTALTTLNSMFDLTDTGASAAEFEMLIIGRIKLALQAKIIKPLRLNYES
jgi:hypothetical protein